MDGKVSLEIEGVFPWWQHFLVDHNIANRVIGSNDKKYATIQQENCKNLLDLSEEYSMKILSHDVGLVSLENSNVSENFETKQSTHAFFAVSL